MTMTEKFDLKSFSGLERDEARFAEITAAFASIAVEIERLRALDLDDVHPAVTFQPLPRAPRT